ncbi:MAG: Ig-like domain repeat protein [Terracidiphilus sp.]
MKKLLFVLSCMILFAVPTYAAAPVCLFTDVLSGPASGGEGGNGIYLTIFGKNFGSTQGTSTVTVNGKPVTQYLMWTHDYNSTAQDAIGVQIANGTTGTGPIVVTTPDGSCSNLSFTVRPGKIYFIGATADNSKPGSCSSMIASNSYSAPWGLTNYASTDESNYSFAKMRTPYTYYQCMSPGDTLVFLNGASYRYFDGRGWHAALTIDNSNATSTSFFTFMARPGATVQLGAEGYALGIRSAGTSSYDVYSEFTLSGNDAYGASALETSPYDRAVGNIIVCPGCAGEAGAFSGTDGTVALGNVLTSISTNTTILPNGSNKEYHAAYFAGNNIEFGWNRIYNTAAYNGFQINHDGSTGFYNLNIHDNDIADVNGSGINLSTIDPSSGFVKVYNNIIHHTGLKEPSDGDGADPHNCIAVKGYYGSAGLGTAEIYNNTMYDCSSYLNVNPNDQSSCAVLIAPNAWKSVTTNLDNNVVYQPAYSGTGSRNVYLCGNPSNIVTGSNNIWYSASTPKSTEYATTIGTIENPKYVNPANGDWSNYALQGNSPAIGAGSVSQYPVMDFNGVTRPRPSAVGALENRSTSSGTQITTSATPNPATADTPVTLTATVAETGGSIPTGSIEFMNGTTSLGQAPLNNNGTASLELSSLSAGTYDVVASYAGDSRYPAGESSDVFLQVQSPTTTSLTTSPNAMIAGQAIALIATVEASGDTFPSGTVNFLNGSTVLGTGTLNSSGVSTMSTSTLAAGTYNLIAQYAGNGNFLSSISPAVSVKVTAGAQSATTTILAATPNPVVDGNALGLTATVKGIGTGIPRGTVNFMSGATLLGSGTLNSSGIATLSTSSLAVGTYSLTARYLASGSFLTSTSTAVSVEVVAAGVQAATTTKLTASPNTVMPGAMLTLFATVNGSGSKAPNGTVSFASGSTLIGAATLNFSGSATLNIDSLPAGTYEVTAKYAGNGTYAASSSAVVSVTVKAQSTTTSLVASPSTAILGQVLTLSATVKGTTIGPGGIVSFFRGSTLLGTANVNSSGLSTLTTKALVAGTYSLTARYSGDGASFPSDSSPVSVTVAAQSTTTSIAASSNTVTAGEALSLTATVKGGDKALPTGSVKFISGSTLLGTGTLNSSGVATLSTTSFAAGTYNLAAEYVGNASSLSSKSGTVSVTVTPKAASTATSLAASPSAVTAGEALVLSATVQAQGATKPSGEVTFLNGSTPLGTATLDSSGVAMLATISLNVGTHTLTAQYAGNPSSLSSKSAGIIVTVKTKAQATATSLATTTNDLTVGDALVLTATVRADGATKPSGMVTFLNGTTVLGTATLNSSGVAKLSSASLPIGTLNLTARFSGNSSFASSASPEASVTVKAEAPAIVRGFLLNAPARDQSEPKQASGTTLCKLPVPGSDSQAGATVTYIGEGGSCGQGPASR